MDVRLTPEQRALRDSAAQVVDRHGPSTVGELDDPERAAKLDAAIAAAGWRELRTPTDDGGPWASGVESEMLRLHVRRRLSDRLDGVSPGPEGSVDKLLMTSVEQAVGHAALAIGGAGHGSDNTWLKVYLYSCAQSVMGGTSQIQRNLVATRILGLPAS